MERSLLSALLLAGALAALLFWKYGRALRPAMIMPLAGLPQQRRERIERRKLQLRVWAIFCFALAALTMFTGLIRGLTLACLALGFFCQYRVYCLRRKYPAHVIQTNGGIGDEG